MTRQLRFPSAEDLEKVLAEERRFNEAALQEMTDEDLQEMERMLERIVDSKPESP